MLVELSADEMHLLIAALRAGNEDTVDIRRAGRLARRASDLEDALHDEERGTRSFTPH